MPNNTTSNQRNQRNNPYLTDQWAAQVQRSGAWMLWRWRTELATLAGTGALLEWLRHTINPTWGLITSALVVVGLGALPWTRRRFWCVLARHRIHRLCWEARLHTRSGRLPLVLRAHPTKVGERLHILCRAGICAEDFEAHIGELRAACFARDARVTRNRRWSQLVTIDIIRRDTLAATHQIPSPLMNTRTRPQPRLPGESEHEQPQELATTGQP